MCSELNVVEHRLHFDRVRWILKHGGTVSTRRLTKQERKEIRDCFGVMDEDGSGALDVDELLEAFQQLGIQPRRSAVITMVRELNNGEDEMEFPVFEMLMAKAYSKQSTDDINVLTNGTNFSFSDIAQTLKRKKLLQDVLDGGSSRDKVIKNQSELLQTFESFTSGRESNRDNNAKTMTSFQIKRTDVLNYLMQEYGTTKDNPETHSQLAENFEEEESLATPDVSLEWIPCVPMVPYNIMRSNLDDCSTTSTIQ
eukprot:g6816.t1